MRKLTHSKFELDLSQFKISDTEENSWFSDSFFTRYSFPFDIDLVDDLNVAFDFIEHHNSSPELYYEVIYTHNNFISKAIFEIEQLQQKLTCTLRFGFESLPSFGKKLSELSLQKLVLPTGTTIYDHANTIVNQTWPNVNYNFPQVHTDKFDTTQYPWATFEKIINKRFNGVFLNNYYDENQGISINRNIIQPLPSWLHIVERGMVDAGYILAGDILEDALLQKALLFTDKDYFTQFIEENNNNLYVFYEVINFPAFSNYNQSITINSTFTAQYLISGEINIGVGGQDSWAKILVNGIEIWSHYHPAPPTSSAIVNHTVEIYTNFNLGDNIIQFISFQPNSVNPLTICDLTISLVVSLADDGTKLPSIYNENFIDLTKVVPDLLFDDFIKIIKNWFNYDITKVVGNTIYMDRIEDNVNHNDVIDFSMFEVKYPVRKYSKGNSFLLKFADIDSKDYTYLPVFQNQSSIVSSNYKVDDKTTTIEINALPLPHTSRNGVQTAHAFENNNSKMYLVPYNGLVGGNNYSLPINEYLIPAVHESNWRKWFDFRINSVNYIWSFKCFIEQLEGLNSKIKIRAYENTHILKVINKIEIAPDQFEVEFDSQTVRV